VHVQSFSILHWTPTELGLISLETIGWQAPFSICCKSNTDRIATSIVPFNNDFLKGQLQQAFKKLKKNIDILDLSVN
jgi:hypothetical protein